MKNGFTLIELLAVIVILAVIAVIAVPIVLNIINDAKESAILRSADFYLEGVETSIATSVLKGITISDGKYSIMEDGNICIGTLLEDTCSGDILKIEMDGEIPKEGTIEIKNGQIKKVDIVLSNKEVWTDPFTEELEYKLAPGLYDENDKLIMTWNELVEKHDFKNKVERNNGYSDSLAGQVIDSIEGASKLVIDDTVTKIGYDAFWGCENLTEVIIPNSVTNIDGAFEDCRNLINISLSENITSIGELTFFGCNSLTSIIIPEGVTSIENMSFWGCISLTSITIPDSVISIDNAFQNCTSLTSIKIGAGVRSMYSTTFESSPNLTSIIVDKNNTVYDSRDNCNAIIHTATNTLELGCKNTIIPDTVTKIGFGSFLDKGLTSIIIPSNVTYIAAEAFSGNSNLTTINYTGTEEEWNAIVKETNWDRNTPTNKVINYNYKG